MNAVFFADPDSINGDLITLDDGESIHASKVMRTKKGETVMVVDGIGGAYRGEIIKCTGRSPVEIRWHSQIRNWGEPTVRLTLAAGLSTADKFDTVVQKGTELGVKRFIPLITEKSKIKLDDPKRVRNKARRLENVATAAMKQCRRSYRPDISSPELFAEFLKRTDDESSYFIFHTGSSCKPFSELDWSGAPKRITAVVGPESGFSKEEFQAAVAAGFTPVTLGSRILRAETAGQAVCALIMNALGELR